MFVMLNNAYLVITRDPTSPFDLHVHARLAGDIERAFAGAPCPMPEIEHRPDADYQYCATVPAARVGFMLEQTARGLAYPGFLDAIEERDRADATLEVDAIMRLLARQRAGKMRAPIFGLEPVIVDEIAVALS